MIFNSEGIIYEDIDCAVDSKEPIIKIFALNNEGYAFITGVNMKFVNVGDLRKSPHFCILFA